MLYSALLFGFLGSFHCVGMCGPIAFMLPVSRDNPVKKFLQVLLYHSGRLLSYSLIGLAFGLLGKSLYLFGYQQQLSIGIGVLMILLVLVPTAKIRKFGLANPLARLISRLQASLGAQLKKKRLDTFFSIGVLNGFLPCGLVYMAVFGAIATGSLAQGSLYMMLFGLGTIPLMTAAIYFSGMLGTFSRKRIQKLIPLFVVLMGFLFVLRGLGLGIPYISPAPTTELVSAEATCH